MSNAQTFLKNCEITNICSLKFALVYFDVYETYTVIELLYDFLFCKIGVVGVQAGQEKSTW